MLAEEEAVERVEMSSRTSGVTKLQECARVANIAPVLAEALRALPRELYVSLTCAAESAYLFLRRYL